MINKHNRSYSGGYPEAVGDRLYAQDLFRDFDYTINAAGRTITDMIGSTGVFIRADGLVTKGDDWTHIDIPVCYGVVEYDVTVPNSFASIPPTTATETIVRRVVTTAQDEYSLSAATLNGSAVNYIKIAYAETNGSSRSRAKKSGTYVYEKVDSFTITVSTVAPTSKQFVIGTLVGDGATTLTITNYEGWNLKKLNLPNIFQDDSLYAKALPAGTYFNFGSPNLTNSAGTAPSIRYNTSLVKSTLFFASRRHFYLNAGYIAYSYTFGNEMIIAMRFKPNMAYNVGTNIYVLDNRNLAGSDSDAILMYFYPTAGGCKLRLIVQDDVTHRFLIDSTEYASNVALQINHTVFVKISKANDNVDMWINGTKIVDGVTGTKTKTGDITAINITKTGFVLGANGGLANYQDFTNTKLYFQDLFFDLNYGETYLTDWDASNDVPYYQPTKELTGKNQNWQITDDGDAGFNNLSCETLNVNSVDAGAGREKTKRVPIGVWNMDSTASVDIAHGITDFTKIIDVSVTIINDALSNHFSLSWFSNAADPILLNGGLGYRDATIIQLIRRTGGYFDANTYDDGTMNRGYIYIKYLA